MPPVLKRATPKNGLFDKLKDDWDAQLASSPDAPTDFYDIMMSHAGKIASEDPQDKVYGVFVLIDETDDKNTQTLEGMVHINHAFPNTAGATLRLVWNLIAPKYQFDEQPDEARLALILSRFLTESVRLAHKDFPSSEVKMWLGNALDREFAGVAVGFLKVSHPNFNFAISGNWLHIKFV